MNLKNQSKRAGIILDGEMVVVDIYYDYVDELIYINNILYDGKDVKSIVSEGQESELEMQLYRIHKQKERLKP